MIKGVGESSEGVVSTDMKEYYMDGRRMKGEKNTDDDVTIYRASYHNYIVTFTVPMLPDLSDH